MDLASSNADEKIEKHRFLVQSKIVEEAEYSRIMNLPAANRPDEVYLENWGQCHFVVIFVVGCACIHVGGVYIVPLRAWLGTG